MRALILSTSAVLLWAAPVSAAEQVPEEVTFAEHISPIIFNNCAGCHRPGEAAPFTLMSYRDVQKRGRTIVQVTERRYMPPWHPEPGHGEFKDDRRLSDQQLALLKRWVETGMAEGDAKKLAKLPTFPEGWQLGKPDLVVRMDRAFPVPASGRDINRNFVIPLSLTEDKWVAAVEVRPSARAVVHHVLFFLDSSGTARKQDGQDGKPGFQGMGFRRSGGLGGWAVGATPRKLPEGLAWSLPKGSDLILQTHFHLAGKAEAEQTTVGLYFAGKPPTRTMAGLMLPPMFGALAGINIPPDKKDFTIRDSFKLPVDVDLVNVGAHAHYIARTMEAHAVLPDGSNQSLFSIRDWDFNWQGRYEFKEFVRLPKGTTLHAELTYDNSADNPRNPNQPPKRIRWGNASTDEMGTVSFTLVPAVEKDATALQKALQTQGLRGLRGGLENIGPGLEQLLRKAGSGGPGRSATTPPAKNKE